MFSRISEEETRRLSVAFVLDIQPPQLGGDKGSSQFVITCYQSTGKLIDLLISVCDRLGYSPGWLPAPSSCPLG